MQDVTCKPTTKRSDYPPCPTPLRNVAYYEFACTVLVLLNSPNSGPVWFIREPWLPNEHRTSWFGHFKGICIKEKVTKASIILLIWQRRCIVFAFSNSRAIRLKVNTRNSVIDRGSLASKLSSDHDDVRSIRVLENVLYYTNYPRSYPNVQRTIWPRHINKLMSVEQFASAHGAHISVLQGNWQNNSVRLVDGTISVWAYNVHWKSIPGERSTGDWLRFHAITEMLGILTEMKGIDKEEGRRTTTL